MAIVAHLLLFGNVFPRRQPYGKKDQPFEDDRSEAEPARKTPTRRILDIPEKRQECEKCLQTAYEDGDYRTVLRCWGQLKKFD